MADRPNYPRSEVMSRIRSANTKPELALRRALHKRGVRYRLEQSIRAGAGRPIKPDLAFKGRQLAVFVDGCFWHGCAEHCRLPATNVEYWSTKISGNAARDVSTDERLRQAGWEVVRVWEHADLDDAAAQITVLLQQ